MVTGASTADLAVILIDARKGVLTQTRRHSYLAHLIGIRTPGAGGEQDGPDRLRRGGRSTRSSPTIASSPTSIGIADVTAIPISGFKGDNITSAPSANTPVVRRAER